MWDTESIIRVCGRQEWVMLVACGLTNRTQVKMTRHGTNKDRIINPDSKFPQNGFIRKRAVCWNPSLSEVRQRKTRQ